MNMYPNTIIIVEDDKQTVALFHNMFRRNCMNLVCLSSRELYQLDLLTRNHQPLMMIFDYVSIMHNYEDTIAMLDLVAPNIPTIIMTTIEENKLATTFDYAVKKPFYPADFFMIIRDVVQRNS